MIVLNIDARMSKKRSFSDDSLESSLFNRDLNRGCLVYMFSLCFSGSNFLITLRLFRVCKIFLSQDFAGFAVFSFCV